MPPALTYLLLALCAGVFVFGFWVDGRKEGSKLFRWRRFSLVLQLGALVAAYGVLRPGRGVDGRAAIRASMQARRPVLIDMYSNY